MGVCTRARLWAAAVVVLLGVVPVALDRDSYPVSTYPMFSHRRSGTESVDTAILVRAGEVQRLSPVEIGATDEVILAAATVSQAISQGNAADLCADIAGRVGGPGEVQVVTERYDAVRWYEGHREPLSRVIHAACVAGGS